MVRMVTVQQFHDHVSEMFRSPDPLLVFRRGRPAALVYPYTSEHLPLDTRRAFYQFYAGRVRQQLKQRGLTEEGILEELSERKRKRAAKNRHRR